MSLLTLRYHLLELHTCLLVQGYQNNMELFHIVKTPRELCIGSTV